MSTFRWKNHLDTVRKLAADGASAREMAEHFGVTERSVHMVLYRNAIRMNPDAVKERQRQRGAKLCKAPAWAETIKSDAYRRKRAKQMRELWQKREYRDTQKKKIFWRWSREDWRQRMSECGKKGIAVVNKILQKRREEQKLLATMTPFERQLYLVRTGKAKVTQNVDVRKRASYDTLGGVATYGD